MGGLEATEVPGLQVQSRKDGSWRDANLLLTHIVVTPTGVVLRVGLGERALDYELVELGEMRKRLQCTPRTASEADVDHLKAGQRVLGCLQPQGPDRKWYDCEVLKTAVTDGGAAAEVLVRWDGTEGRGVVSGWLSLGQRSLKIPMLEDVSQHPKFKEWVGMLERHSEKSQQRVCEGRHPQGTGLENEPPAAAVVTQPGTRTDPIVVDLTASPTTTASHASDRVELVADPRIGEVAGPKANGAQGPAPRSPGPPGGTQGPLCALRNGHPTALAARPVREASPIGQGGAECQSAGGLGAVDLGNGAGGGFVVGAEGIANPEGDGGLSCTERMLDDSDGEDQAAARGVAGGSAPFGAVGVAHSLSVPGAQAGGRQVGIGTPARGYPDLGPAAHAGMAYGPPGPALQVAGLRPPGLASLPPVVGVSAPQVGPGARPAYLSVPGGRYHGGLDPLVVPWRPDAVPRAQPGGPVWGSAPRHYLPIGAQVPIGGHWPGTVSGMGPESHELMAGPGSHGSMPGMGTLGGVVVHQPRGAPQSLLTDERLTDLDGPLAGSDRRRSDLGPPGPRIGQRRLTHAGREGTDARAATVDLYCDECALEEPQHGARVAGPGGPPPPPFVVAPFASFAPAAKSHLRSLQPMYGAGPRDKVAGLVNSAVNKKSNPLNKGQTASDFRAAALARVPALSSLPGAVGHGSRGPEASGPGGPGRAGPQGPETASVDPDLKSQTASRARGQSWERRAGREAASKVEADWGDEEDGEFSAEGLSRLGILYLAACCFADAGPGPGPEQFRAARKVPGGGENVKRRKLSWQDI
ncbi:unnamed protein product [Ostreobium quekettii]|uniref:Tudor domain-containing protein n=1 Tax=Ostreobium quekettii TaxID=121088 RepID=A0A8S1J7S6_9CHLO|nr:unnamed protein product [Ostreobium quekettii]|eukprot:evm.model.scf_700.2 EVM.evm.TU.scf_700.2   scf_700:29650-35903(+)